MQHSLNYTHSASKHQATDAFDRNKTVFVQ